MGLMKARSSKQGSPEQVNIEMRSPERRQCTVTPRRHLSSTVVEVSPLRCLVEIPVWLRLRINSQWKQIRKVLESVTWYAQLMMHTLLHVSG
jgi:hypothetical protein